MAKRGRKPYVPTLRADASTCRCCPNAAITRGLCRRCYNAAFNRGILDDVALPSRGNVTAAGTASPFWKSGPVNYNTTHKRLARLRGPARDQACAEPYCQRQAAQWSYDGYCPQERARTTTGAPFCPHLEHYQPRCIPCHRAWDRDSDIVAIQLGNV